MPLNFENAHWSARLLATNFGLAAGDVVAAGRRVRGRIGLRNAPDTISVLTAVEIMSVLSIKAS